MLGSGIASASSKDIFAAMIETRTVTDDQLSRFATLIYDRTGIRISPQKKTLISNRLNRRLKATGLTCFDDYFRKLNSLRQDDAEWHAFLQEITTHETYLFRDTSQWDWFAKTYLSEVQQAARKGERKKTLRVWSAASSTGDEAYTIASCIAGVISNLDEWRIEILGTDIGVGAIQQAKEATFSERAMRRVPESYQRRFFTKVGDCSWQAKSQLQNWTQFRRHNLMEPLRVPAFDLIFVKNVFIYFDRDAKQKALNNIDQVLVPGGLLVTGPAEGAAELLRHYERLQPWLHQKQ